MPTYQYACTDCTHAFEQVQSFSDDPLIDCPECSGRLRKLFSAVGVVFKGSGFYRNDSRQDRTAGSTGASGSGSGNGDGGSKEPASASTGSGSTGTGSSGSGSTGSGDSGSTKSGSSSGATSGDSAA